MLPRSNINFASGFCRRTLARLVNSPSQDFPSYRIIELRLILSVHSLERTAPRNWVFNLRNSDRVSLYEETKNDGENVMRSVNIAGFTRSSIRRVPGQLRPIWALRVSSHRTVMQQYWKRYYQSAMISRIDDKFERFREIRFNWSYSNDCSSFRPK